MKTKKTLSFFLYLIIIMGSGFLIDQDSHSVSDTLINLAPLTIVLSPLLLIYFNKIKKQDE